LKVNGQACFFITIFTEEYMSSFVSWVEHFFSETMDPCIRFGKKPCYLFLREFLHNIREKFYRKDLELQSQSSSILGTLWHSLIMLIIIIFFISCIEQFAQAEATRLHLQQLEILQDSEKKEQ